MKNKVEFGVIRWRNLMSSGNAWTEIPLNKWPNVLIVGDNGAGKTTLLDAITFVLFGKPFRKIKKGQMVNTINAKNCEVQIEFETNQKCFKIIRGIKPDVFEIWQDGILINQDSASKDYQAYLEKFVLGMNLKTFVQIDVVGKTSYVPFMKLNASDRRNFIEDLLDIRVFSSMSTIVKTELTDNKNSIEKVKVQIASALSKKALIENTGNMLSQNANKEKSDLLDENIKHTMEHNSLSVEIGRMEVILESLEKEIANYSKVRSKHDKMISLRGKIAANKDTHEEHYKFFDDHSNCPTCTQEIDEETKDRELCRIDTKLSELRKGLHDLDAEIVKSQAILDDLMDKQREHSKIQQEISTRTWKRKELTDRIQSNKDKISKLENSNDMIDQNNREMKLVEEEIENLEKQQAELLEQNTLLTTASDLLKDGGIKTKIIRKYIPIINKTINKYLQAMGFLVQFTLDETFDETIKARYRDEFSYESFSEGEKMRIDLALLFTWRHIAKMKNSANTNLLIIDEVFDGSLDNAGIDEFLKIMWGLTSDTNTIIISHKQDQMIDKFKKVYKAEKKKNFSVLKEMA